MEIQGRSSHPNPFASGNPHTKEGKEEIKKEAQKLNAHNIMLEYTFKFQLNITQTTQGNLATQSALGDPKKLNDILKGIDHKTTGYTGKPINELNPKEAKELISEKGYFGVAKTSERLAEFVLKGSGGDLNLLQKGREGILRGYKQAEKLWGGELPEISKETLAKALKKIDEAIAKKGGKLLNEKA
ncbi:MAG: hydrogenase-4 component G [Wolinella sp.]